MLFGIRSEMFKDSRVIMKKRYLVNDKQIPSALGHFSTTCLKLEVLEKKRQKK